MSSIFEIFERTPPLRKKKNPTVALIMGFVLGGLGLGIYFWSLIDFVIPIVITIAIVALVGDPGVIAGALIAALWGYFRAVSSNNNQV